MTRWKGPQQLYGGPWYGNDVERVIFERGAKRHFPSVQGMTRTSGPKAGRAYAFTIEVPHYEQRHVEVLFPKNAPTLAKIATDGPTDSPHRYEENQLCIWFPDDPDGSKWVFDDGLLVLFGLIVAHLFREAWWRETGEWLGPGVGHPVQTRQEGATAA